MAQLPRRKNIVLDHRYWLGTLKDFSTYGNDGSVIGPIYWARNKTLGVMCRGSGYISVPDDSSLRIGTYTLFMAFSQPRRAEGTEPSWFFKRSGLGVFDLKADTYLKLYAGGVLSYNTIDPTGVYTIAATLASGEKPIFYLDGVNVGLGNVALYPDITDTGPVVIGSGASTAPTQPISQVLIWNTVLTPEEIAQVHKWAMSVRTPKETKRHFVLPSLVTENQDGLIAAWDMKPKNGKIIDKTGNGYDMNLTGGQFVQDGFPALRLFDTDVVSQVKAGVNLSTYSLSVWFKKGGTTAPNAQLLGDLGASFMGMSIYYSNGKVLVYVGNGSSWLPSASYTVLDNKWTHYVAVSTGSEVQFWVDGVLFDSFACSVSPQNLAHLRIGTYIQTANGYIAEPVVYGHALSFKEIKALYQKYAKRPYLIDDLSDARVSLSSEGGAIDARLSNTIWKFGDTTGGWSIVEDDEKGRVIQCDTAGLLYTESQQAYGTWKFDVFKGTSASQPSVVFMSDTHDDQYLSPTHSYGYMLYMNTDPLNRVLLSRLAGSSFVYELYTDTNYVAPDSVRYSFKVTRRYGNQFTVYIKGGSFGDTWTLVDVSGGYGTNPKIDTHVAVSKYCVLDLDAGDRVANFRFFPGMV